MAPPARPIRSAPASIANPQAAPRQQLISDGRGLLPQRDQSAGGSFDLINPAIAIVPESIPTRPSLTSGDPLPKPSCESRLFVFHSARHKTAVSDTRPQCHRPCVQYLDAFPSCLLELVRSVCFSLSGYKEASVPQEILSVTTNSKHIFKHNQLSQTLHSHKRTLSSQIKKFKNGCFQSY